MNLGQLKTMVSVWLDDLQFGYFTQSQITTWLNNAQKEAQKLLIQAGANYYTIPVYTPLIVGQNLYQLPDDFIDLNRLSIITQGTITQGTATENPLIFITLNQRDLVSNQSGQPQYYTIVKNKLRLYPVPQQSQPLKMVYSPEVDDMVNDTDVPDVPNYFHEYLAVLATIDGFLRDGRDMSAFLEKRRYYEEKMKDQAQDRNVDAPRQVVALDQFQYGDYFW